MSYPSDHLREILDSPEQTAHSGNDCHLSNLAGTSPPVYQDKLWNGQYYQLDSESGSDVVMADQLCGQFYARLRLPDIVLSDCTARH